MTGPTSTGTTNRSNLRADVLAQKLFAGQMANLGITGILAAVSGHDHFRDVADGCWEAARIFIAQGHRRDPLTGDLIHDLSGLPADVDATPASDQQVAT